MSKHLPCNCCGAVITARQLLKSNTTYAEAEWYFVEGYMTEREWRRYRLAWEWSAPRFGGLASWKQDHYCQTHGTEAYYRRIARVRRVLGFEPAAMYTPWPVVAEGEGR